MGKFELAALFPSKYLYRVVDGADQSKVAFPCFTSPVKDQPGHEIAVHFIGCFRHGTTKKLRLLTMTDEQAEGSNHIIESFHTLINEIDDSEGGIPSRLFFQLHNCWRENNNRFLWPTRSAWSLGKYSRQLKSVSFP